jgi:hypothetical protein
MYKGHAVHENPMLTRLLDAMENTLPDVAGILKETPVVVLPTLDYEAYAHHLNSGQPFVGVSQMMITYPMLLAELSYGGLDALVEENPEAVLGFCHKATVLCWNLNSGNHELSGYVASQSEIGPLTELGVIQTGMVMIGFLVLHELAHIFLGHTPSEDRDTIRHQEFEADIQASKWWYQMLSPREHWDRPAFGLACMFQFFDMADFLKEAPPKKYPSWHERYQQAAQSLIGLGVPEISFDFANVLFGIARGSGKQTIVFAIDTSGHPKPYAPSGGLLESIDRLALGEGSITLLMIDREGKCHAQHIDKAGLSDYLSSLGST